MAELVCVPPDNVFQIWPFVRDRIREAMRRGGLSGFNPVERHLLANKSLLWIVVDANKIKAAIVTQLEVTEWSKACVIVACAGAGMNEWLPLVKGIEKFAAAEGCDCVRFYGRKGWARMLPQYAQRHVVLEKRIK